VYPRRKTRFLLEDLRIASGFFDTLELGVGLQDDEHWLAMEVEYTYELFDVAIHRVVNDRNFGSHGNEMLNAG